MTHEIDPADHHEDCDGWRRYDGVTLADGLVTCARCGRLPGYFPHEPQARAAAGRHALGHGLVECDGRCKEGGTA